MSREHDSSSDDDGFELTSDQLSAVVAHSNAAAQLQIAIGLVNAAAYGGTDRNLDQALEVARRAARAMWRTATLLNETTRALEADP